MDGAEPKRGCKVCAGRHNQPVEFPKWHRSSECRPWRDSAFYCDYPPALTCRANEWRRFATPRASDRDSHIATAQLLERDSLRSALATIGNLSYDCTAGGAGAAQLLLNQVLSSFNHCGKYSPQRIDNAAFNYRR
jgi:hypothetical protein